MSLWTVKIEDYIDRSRHPRQKKQRHTTTVTSLTSELSRLDGQLHGGQTHATAPSRSKYVRVRPHDLCDNESWRKIQEKRERGGETRVNDIKVNVMFHIYWKPPTSIFFLYS